MANYRLISFNKIPSTQTAAHQLVIDNQATDKTAIMADAQTAGRGRYRRTWISNKGNLYVSFIYKIEKRDPRLSYYVAVAVAETLMSLGITPTIKWPNDVLIDGKKVSGILIEYAKDFVIIGIGINIKSCPKIAEYETAKLSDHVKTTRDEVLTALIRYLDQWLGADFTKVRERWMALAAGINETIVHRGRPAILIGINEDGALVMRRGSEYIMAFGDEISM